MPLPDPQPAFYPRLPTTFVVDSEGYLVDPFSLEVEVRDESGAEMLARTACVLSAYPGGDRLGPGYYRARTYSPQADAGTTGRRYVTWFAVFEDGDEEVSWTTVVERTPTTKPDLGVPYYALLQDLRDEGFTTTALPDARAFVLLARASLYIERFTGRRFIPEPRAIRVNGRGGPILQLGEPIVALDPVDGVRVLLEPYPSSPSLHPYGRDAVRVYARHLHQRLRSPDDRENPKLEVYYPTDVDRTSSARGSALERLTFPRGQQNVWLRGVFGYTDPDGSPMGRTPELIKLAAMLIVRREVEKIGTGSRSTAAVETRITAERTRDQSVSYAAPGSAGAGSALLGVFTGDPEIDTILASFRRQHAFGAV